MLNLKHLRLNGTNVGSGLELILSRFPALETLEVGDTAVSADDRTSILKRFPRLEFKNRGDPL